MSIKKFEYFMDEPLFKDSISPSKKNIPDWYKKIKKEKQVVGNGLSQNVKACIPFLDAITSGYSVELSQDILITSNEDSVYVNWKFENTKATKVTSRPQSNIPIPEEFYGVEFVWQPQTAFRVPKGYSILVSHPFNRVDLPFYTMSGVIDAEDVVVYGNYPFFIKKGFNGILPAGTPIMQILPFKRESWKSEYSKELDLVNKKATTLSDRILSGWYKNSIWKKKSYE